MDFCFETLRASFHQGCSSLVIICFADYELKSSLCEKVKTLCEHQTPCLSDQHKKPREMIETLEIFDIFVPKMSETIIQSPSE